MIINVSIPRKVVRNLQFPPILRVCNRFVVNLVKSLLPTHVLGAFSYKKVLPYFFCETISEQEWIFFEIRIRMDIIDWICIVVLHGCCQTNRCWESNSLGMIFHYTLYKEQLKKQFQKVVMMTSGRQYLSFPFLPWY